MAKYASHSLYVTCTYNLAKQKGNIDKAYISFLMVAKICSHYFGALTHTAKHCCCECKEIFAICRQCIEIYR